MYILEIAGGYFIVFPAKRSNLIINYICHFMQTSVFTFFGSLLLDYWFPHLFVNQNTLRFFYHNQVPTQDVWHVFLEYLIWKTFWVILAVAWCGHLQILTIISQLLILQFMTQEENIKNLLFSVFGFIATLSNPYIFFCLLWITFSVLLLVF